MATTWWLEVIWQHWSDVQVTVHNVQAGSAQRRRASFWKPIMSLFCYGVVAVIVGARLSRLSRVAGVCVRNTSVVLVRGLLLHYGCCCRGFMSVWPSTISGHPYGVAVYPWLSTVGLSWHLWHGYVSAVFFCYPPAPTVCMSEHASRHAGLSAL